MVNVEIVYAPSGGNVIQKVLSVSAGSTVQDVIYHSNLSQQFPEIAHLPVGIFSKQVPRNTPVREGNRIEIYRHLSGDPKEKRRQRAKKRI